MDDSSDSYINIHITNHACKCMHGKQIIPDEGLYPDLNLKF